MISNFERAQRYLEKLDPAVSGNGGHNAAFKAACKLVEFGLSESEALELMRDFNHRCSPPWSESDLAHKVRDAFTRAEHGKKIVGGLEVKPYVPAYRPPPAAQPQATKPATYDAAPVELPEPIPNGAAELIRAAFRPDDGVRICRAVKNEEGREVPEDAGVVLPAKQWLARLESCGGDPNDALFSSSDGCGIYVGVNPMQPGGAADSHVTDFRHALLEGDKLHPEEQLAVIMASKVPAVAVIYSGGKSIHAWVKIDAKDRAQYDERVAVLYAHFSGYGVDNKNKNPSRFSRLPGAVRFSKRQSLLLTNVGAASWGEWHAGVLADGVGTIRTVDQLEAYDTGADPNTLLGNRYLCKGGALTLIGPSGVGKSSLAMQFAVLWSVGRPAFGIAPKRPLKVLVVQAENDDGDLSEQLAGVRAAQNLDAFGPPDEVATLKQNLVFVRDTTHTGPRFAAALRILIEKHKPDLVVFDPLLSFVGGDISRQEVCSEFLRGHLNPISETTGVAWFMIHHTGKPPSDKDARKNWQTSDFAYSGMGSSELTNWTRAAMVLRQAGEGDFRLMLAKRGKRAGATHPDGEPTDIVWLRHARQGIHWEHVQPPEEPAQEEKPARKGQDSPEPKERRPAGRPSKAAHALAVLPWEEFVATIPPEGWCQNEACRQAENWAAARGHDLKKTAIAETVLPALLESKKVAKIDSKYKRPTPHAQ